MATRGGIQDPGVPGQTQVVNPSEDAPTEGLTTMKDMFNQGGPQIVDEVVEQRIIDPDDGIQWAVIRPNSDVEDMTVGHPMNRFSFKAGVRYRVPLEVAEILYNREKLLEQPYPYEG